MKFKHTHPTPLDTEAVGVTQPGDIITETRPEIIAQLMNNPFFQAIVKVKKETKEEEN